MTAFARTAGRLVLLLSFSFLATKTAFRLLPGDPITIMLGESPAPARAEELRAELGLDRPFLVSLVDDAKRALQGDLGDSFLSGMPVAPTLGARTARSLGLGALAVALAFFSALPLAALSASGSRGARVLLTLWFRASTALSPAWLGPLVLLAFAVWVPLFPTAGSVWLPALTLSFFTGGFWAKLAEARIRETIERGSVRGARARGTAEISVLARHGVAPALPGLFSAFGAHAGALLGGAFIAETVFGWPGLGAYLVDSVLSRDLPAVQAAVFASAALSVLALSLGDLASRLIDPREGAG